MNRSSHKFTASVTMIFASLGIFFLSANAICAFPTLGELRRVVAPPQANDENELIIPSISEVDSGDVAMTQEQFNKGGGKMKMIGDMYLTKEQYEAHFGSSNSQSHFEKRKGIADPDRLWPKYSYGVPIVTYDIHSNLASFENDIREAMAEWEEKTCLRFHRTTTGSRILFQDCGLSCGKGCWLSEGCNSLVGYQNEVQRLCLSRNGCIRGRTILHEIGHAIGLYHEQNRSDRDRYVRILVENISPHRMTNFDEEPEKLNHRGVPYDYLSIMHYSSNAFSKNGNMTIETLDPSFQNLIGTGRHLSPLDVELVNKMYECGKLSKHGCIRHADTEN